MDLQEKTAGIVRLCLGETDTNPYAIFHHIAATDYVSIHDPEHHVLDGACLLTAYRNAGGSIDLPAALEKLRKEGERMPGAICGLWGVCGAVLSVGCALAILDGTGPLSEDGSWGEHMSYTARALEKIAGTYGPRCCKRDGMLALSVGIDYIREKKGVVLGTEGAVCGYSARNSQCIHGKCPYYKP